MDNNEITICELCSRREETEEIIFDGNTFQACELCRTYLESDWSDD